MTRGSLHGWSALSLEPPLTAAIIAFKSQGRTATKHWFAGLLAPLLQTYLLVHPNLILVSMPSRKAALKKRGFDHGRALALAVQRQTGVAAPKNLLKFAREAKDQRNLSSASRASNLAGSMVATSCAQPTVLIDDVITTGATLIEARRALEAAGVRVIGFITIAETLSKN